MRPIALRASLGLAAVAMLAGCGQPAMTFQTALSGAYEVPPTTSRATGTVNATIWPDTRAMTYTVTYQGLTGPATAAHFHGPAAVGMNAPPVVTSTVSPSPITGSATLTEKQFADLQAGLWYYNVHSAAFPNGEIRGQMVRVR